MNYWFKRPLWFKILVAIVIGIILGLTLGENTKYIKPIGTIFLRLLQMLIVPLTFFTIISGITKMEDLRSLRSVGGRVALLYIITSTLASAIGMFMALILKPGKNVAGLLSESAVGETQAYNFIDNMINWIPTNPFQAFVNAEMLQIIVFALFVGIAMLALGERVKKVREGFDQFADVMIKITDFVMQFAPYGILALMADMIANLGTDLLSAVGVFILTDYLALLVMLLFGYPLLLKFLGKINVLNFFKKISPAMLVAASTTSSAATLPVSMHVAGKELKIPEKIYGFILPLGATVNMDGMATALGVISVFAANLNNLTITPAYMLQFIFLGLILSIGAAGVKGAGIVMSSVLLQTLGLPLTLVPILAAIWPIIDIGHTTLNITGDLTCTTVVASQLHEIDPKSI